MTLYYIPPTPINCGSTNGTTSIEITCSAGVGNVTDGFYFVNTNNSNVMNQVTGTWNNTGLTQGTLYEYHIYGVNGSNLSLAYATIQNTTIANATITNYVNFTFSNITQSEPQIYMSAQANRVKVDINDSDGFIQNVSVGITYLGYEFIYPMTGGNDTWSYDFKSGVPGTYYITKFYAMDNASGNNSTVPGLGFVVVPLQVGQGTDGRI